MLCLRSIEGSGKRLIDSSTNRDADHIKRPFYLHVKRVTLLPTLAKGGVMRLRKFLSLGLFVALTLFSKATCCADGDLAGVLFDPHASDSSATAGYPRALSLKYADSSLMLATLAVNQDSSPGFVSVFRSKDQGETWEPVTEIRSHVDGWDLEAPTLFEVDNNVGDLQQGDLLVSGTSWKKGDYTSQRIEVFISKDKGLSWSYRSVCTETSALPNSWGHGIWEPFLLQHEDGRIACFISDERPANSEHNSQFIGHYVSVDGGLTWSDSIEADVAFPLDPLARPGMQTIVKLLDGTYAMAYETCRDATDPNHACEVYIKHSNDGFDWSPANSKGTLVETMDSRHLLHTPYLSIVDDGSEQGVLLLSGQRVVAGPTGNKTILEESGSVIFANYSAGAGEWFEVSAPVSVNPTGSYGPGEQSCAGYSTPAVDTRTGEGSFVYLASQWTGDGDKCAVHFGRGIVPPKPFQLAGPGGRCLDVDTNTAVNGNRVQLWDCGIATGQRWTLYPDDTLRAFGKCLDIDGNSTENFSPVQLWDCNGSGGQKWQHTANGALFNPQSGRCLDAPAGSTANGTWLQIYNCNGLWTQRWEKQ